MKICSLLWRQLYFSEDGSFYPCCLTRGNPSAEFRDESGQIIKASQPNAVLRAWNSPTISRLRLEMQNGQQPDVCDSCFLPEARGDRSLRLKSNQSYFWEIGEKTSLVELPISDLRALDLRFGDVCNLKCRMCHPDFSRGLTNEYHELHGGAGSPKLLESSPKKNWFENLEMKMLLGESENIDTVNFAGGEALLVKESFDLLRTWVNSGKSKEISLSYNTNLTILPKEVLELWPHFREVRINVSVDGFSEVNSYIRHPSKWEKLEMNMRELDQNPQKYGVTYLGVHTTLQIYNIFDFPNLVNWLKGFYFFHPYPDVTVLTSPEHFQIRHLPDELKLRAKSLLQELLPSSEVNPIDRYFSSSIRGAIQFLNEPGQRDKWDRFKEVTRFFDRKRGQTVTVIPELAPYFSNSLESDLRAQKNSPASLAAH